MKIYRYIIFKYMFFIRKIWLSSWMLAALLVAPQNLAVAQEGPSIADRQELEAMLGADAPEALDRMLLKEILRKAKPAPMPLAEPDLTITPQVTREGTGILEFNPRTGEEVVILPVDTDQGASGGILDDEPILSPPYEGEMPSLDGIAPETLPKIRGKSDGVDTGAPAIPSITPTTPTPLVNTIPFPWRTVVKLLMRFEVSGTNYYYVCSGATINSFLVYTAGHCIYNHDPNGDGNTSDARWADEIWVWPGQTDRVYIDGEEDFPYGVAKVVFQRTYQDWVENRNLNLDFGWITLDRRIGERVGWMGRESGVTASSLNFSGYPSETPYVPPGEVFQYPGFDSGNVRSYTTYRIEMDAYTYGGHSGGPVWRYSDDRYIQGVNSTSNRSGYAEATRVTSGIMSNTDAIISDDEANRAPTGRPELIEYVISVTAKDLLTNSVTSGGTIQVEYNAYNIGWVSTTAMIDFYLSTNNVISTSDYKIGTRTHSLGSNTYTNPTASLTVPGTVPSGTYYVGWIMSSSVAEYNTDNNSAVIGSERLMVGASSPADLITIDPGVSKTTLGPGEGFTVSATVRNQGGETAAATTLRFYYSTNSIISTGDTQIGISPVGSLAPGATSPESITANGPATSDTYWIGACVDAVSGESPTNNQCSSGIQITIVDPDIRIEPLSLTFDLENPAEALIRNPLGGILNRNINQLQTLLAKAKVQDTVRVIVGLDAQFEPEGQLAGPSRAQNQRASIRSVQQSVSMRMAGMKFNAYTQFRYIPFMAVEVDAAALQRLATLTEVRTLQEDIAEPPIMASSNPVIGSPNAWAAGYDGSGRVVAVLDTGVDKSHPFFSTGGNKVVSEACYSTTNAAANATTVCPGGVSESIAPGAGINCSTSVSGCDHGTHVAGTVAGNDGGGPNYGVAHGAKLIAVQVFSRFDGAALCSPSSSPCVKTYISDQIKGLERIYALRNNFDIAAINMSLGGGRYFDQASCDGDQAARKAAIDNLRSVGIATVIASGNSGFTDSMGAPGCISSAVSVGATDDNDNVANFSNIASFIDLLAPGVSIDSSVPGGGIGTKQGTSMATPHVAGAWAVVKQANPAATVDDILFALKSNGTLVNDNRAGGTVNDMSRINVDLAVGGAPSGQNFIVYNDGAGLLSVSNIEPQTTASWITVNPTILDVPAGQSRLVWVDVDYGLAPVGETVTRLLVYSNDPDKTPYPGGVNVVVRNGNQVATFAKPGQAMVDHNWKTVTLDNSYTDPVVILGPVSYHGNQPAVARLRNVSGDGFEIRVQEYDYLDGYHATEAIAHLVLESGRHTLADDSVWEVGTFNLEGTGTWQPKSFSAAFEGIPALFLTMQTYNGAQAVTVRARNVSQAGFQAALFEQEALMDGHVPERVGYLAVYSPNGSGQVDMGGESYPYLLQRVAVDERWTPVLGSTLQLQEDTSWDTETGHLDETVAVLAVGEHLFAQDISTFGGDPVALRIKGPEYGAPMEWGTVTGVAHNWVTVPLARRYTHPVVVAKMAQFVGGDPSVIRLRNVTSNAFQVRVQEWNYLDGSHAAERLFYLVSEAGSHGVAGLQVEADTLETDFVLADGWVAIDFNPPFAGTPALFTSVMSHYGGDAVTVRAHNLSGLGVDLTMQEQESKNDGHIPEQVGWIAIEQGDGVTADGRQIDVFNVNADHTPALAEFAPFFDRRFPVMVQSLSSTWGGDPAIAAQQNLAPPSVQVYVREETSADAEVGHVAETISGFAAE